MKYLILIWHLVFSSSAIAAEVGLIVNLMGPQGYGDRQWDNYYTQELLKQGRVGLKFIIVNAENAEDLNLKLQANAEIQNSAIKVLHVSAHGKSIKYQHSDGSFHFEMAVKNLGNIYFDEELKAGFKSLYGRFSAEAIIVFDSCRLLERGSLEEKKNNLLKVAQGFGMKSGKIYLNRTDGSWRRVVHAGTPAFAKEGNPKIKFWRIFQHALRNHTYLNGISYLLDGEDIILDQFINNKGYSLALAPSGQSTMIEDNYWNAVKAW